MGKLGALVTLLYIVHIARAFPSETIIITESDDEIPLVLSSLKHDEVTVQTPDAEVPVSSPEAKVPVPSQELEPPVSSEEEEGCPLSMSEEDESDSDVKVSEGTEPVIAALKSEEVFTSVAQGDDAKPSDSQPENVEHSAARSIDEKPAISVVLENLEHVVSYLMEDEEPTEAQSEDAEPIDRQTENVERTETKAEDAKPQTEDAESTETNVKDAKPEAEDDVPNEPKVEEAKPQAQDTQVAETKSKDAELPEHHAEDVESTETKMEDAEPSMPLPEHAQDIMPASEEPEATEPLPEEIDRAITHTENARHIMARSEEGDIDTELVYPESQSPSNKKSNLVTIDLSECTCTTGLSACEMTVLKSPFMDLTCGDEENLCCPMTKSDEKESSQSQVRVYPISASYFPAYTDSTEKYFNKKAGKGKNCACKSRDTCPQKYIDYGFGFHCSYNTVRCCIPDEQVTTTVVEREKLESSDSAEMASIEVDTVEQEGNTETVTTTEEKTEVETLSPEPMAELEALDRDAPPASNVNAEGELLITEVTQWDDQEEEECLCLPIYKCQSIANYDAHNMIERRRDTLCPGDLVQCCARNIMEEVSKLPDEVPVEHNAPPAPEFQQEQEEAHVAPTPEIPVMNETTAVEQLPAIEELPSVEVVQTPQLVQNPYPAQTTYQSPPQTSYYNPGYIREQQQQPQPQQQYPSSYYPGQPQQGYYRPSPNTYEAPPQQSYRPWFYSNAPSNGYPTRNGYEGDTPRGHSSGGGIFDTLTKFLGFSKQS